MKLHEIYEGTRCWKGYKKKGMKTMFGKRVPNCVKNEEIVDFPGTYVKKEYVDINGVKMLKDVWDYMSQDREEEHGFDDKANRVHKKLSNFTGDEDPRILKKAYQIELRNFIEEFKNQDMDPQPFIDELDQLEEGEVVGMNPDAVKPYFTPEEADRANIEWVNQAQVDQEDGVIVRGTDDKQYRIMTSYNNEHFEDGEVYLDGLTDPTYIDTEGYPDAAELLYYHSATGHYPEDEDYEVVERNLNPAVKDYVKGKSTKLIKVRVADLDDEAIDDRFGRVIGDPDPDVGVDLDDPILLDKDGKTILDGFHRVYQAKRVGRKVIPAEIVDENFKDGKVKGKSRPGRVKRAGASCKGSVTSLRKKAKNSSGEKAKMYHWCANMKAGRKKK